MMSGQGGGALSLLLNKSLYPNIQFTAIVSNNQISNSKLIADAFSLRCFSREMELGENSPELFYRRTSEFLKRIGVRILFYCGYMHIVPEFFAQEFPGINIHPADLTIVDHNQCPKYTGMDCIRRSILDGIDRLGCSVHMVDARVDEGDVFAVARSERMPLHALKESYWVEHAAIKQIENLLFPAAINRLSKLGRAWDKKVLEYGVTRRSNGISIRRTN